MSTDPPTLIGAGKEAEVFDREGRVLKLYRRADARTAAFREAFALALAASFGLPAPSVEGVECVDGRWGVVMSKAAGSSFADAILDGPDEEIGSHLEAMASLHAHILACDGQRLGTLKARLRANIRSETGLGRARERRLLDRLADLPDGDRLCHGDLHPGNVMGSPDQAVVVDWLDAGCGDPAADVCRSYVLMKPVAPALADAYVEHCLKRLDMRQDAVWRWLPCVAAARLAEGAPETADALMDMVDSA